MDRDLRRRERAARTDPQSENARRLYRERQRAGLGPLWPDGVYSEISAWNVELSAENIEELYNQGRGRNV